MEFLRSTPGVSTRRRPHGERRRKCLGRGSPKGENRRRPAHFFSARHPLEADGDDPHLLKRLTAGVGFRLPDLLHHLHSLHHLSENGVLAREVGVSPRLMKNWEPLVLGPAFAMAMTLFVGGREGRDSLYW